MTRTIRYKGYEVALDAARLPNGLFAANLTIEKASGGPSRALSFDAIDFFFEEEHALAYASRWGRLWVDAHA
ncbi:transcriptional regulator [Paraburkholderia sp. Se-20369]|nr:transcriptional regulator [Paraburkholderia sp. Se-20369]TCW77366.1 transcriptional regulator [Burkholderia sp. SRS-46]